MSERMSSQGGPGQAAMPPDRPTESASMSLHDFGVLLAEKARLEAELQKGCQCICHSYPDHDKTQDELEGLRWHQGRVAELEASLAASEGRIAKVQSEIGGWQSEADEYQRLSNVAKHRYDEHSSYAYAQMVSLLEEKLKLVLACLATPAAAPSGERIRDERS